MNATPVLVPKNLEISTYAEAGAPPTTGTPGIAISRLVSLTAAGPANVTDGDTDAHTGIALVGASELHGYWWYSVDGGANWSRVATVNDTDLALLLRASDRLYFQPGAAVPATVADALTFRAWDQTTGAAGAKMAPDGGAGSAFSVALDRVALKPAVLVPNGGFDVDLAGWVQTGGGKAATTVAGQPAELTAAAGRLVGYVEDFLELGKDAIQTAVGTVPAAGHAIKLENPLQLTERMVLAFDWAFSTLDSGITYADFGFVSVNGVVTKLAQAQTTSGTFSVTVDADTPLKLGWGAFDVGDNSQSAILRVDNVRLTAVNPPAASVAAPTLPAAPSTPDLTAGADTGDSASDDITNATAPVFTGTGVDGTTVTLYAGTRAIGSAVVAEGVWSITASTLAHGVHAIIAKATDAQGYQGPASSALAVTVLTHGPAAPVILSPDRSTNTAPTLSGSAEAGASISVVVGGATFKTVATGGAWSVDLATAVPTAGSLALDLDGANAVTVTAVDVAGNVSSAASQTLQIHPAPAPAPDPDPGWWPPAPTPAPAPPAPEPAPAPGSEPESAPEPIPGPAGSIFRLYETLLGRPAEPEGMDYFTSLVEGGAAWTDIVQGFYLSDEFAARHGDMDDVALVTQLYLNALGRPPEEEGLAYHLAVLAAHPEDGRLHVILGIADSEEAQVRLVGVLADAGAGLEAG